MDHSFRRLLVELSASSTFQSMNFSLLVWLESIETVLASIMESSDLEVERREGSALLGSSSARIHQWQTFAYIQRPIHQRLIPVYIVDAFHGPDDCQMMPLLPAGWHC